MGTEDGVIKIGFVPKLLPKDDQWDPYLISKMRGTPWMPVPGKDQENIPTHIESNRGRLETRGDVDEEIKVDDDVHEEVEMEDVDATEGKVDRGKMPSYVKQKCIEDFGKTKGCPGCTAGGRYKAPHNSECRKRIFDEIHKQRARGSGLSEEERKKTEEEERLKIHREEELDEDMSLEEIYKQGRRSDKKKTRQRARRTITKEEDSKKGQKTHRWQMKIPKGKEIDKKKLTRQMKTDHQEREKELPHWSCN